MNFSLSEEEIERYKTWVPDILKMGIEKQKSVIKENHLFYPEYEYCWSEGYPYCGAIGGQFEFTFTPTSLGTIASVKDNVTGEKLILTDFGDF